MLQYNTIGDCFPFGPISVQLGLAPFARFSRGTFGVSVSETTGLKALSLPPLRGGPLPFTATRASMVSDTDTPKSSVRLDNYAMCPPSITKRNIRSGVYITDSFEEVTTKI